MSELQLELILFLSILAGIEFYNMKLGYDPMKVFEEGMKEINERTGAYDAEVGKWVKQPKKENAYKADYAKAKL